MDEEEFYYSSDEEDDILSFYDPSLLSDIAEQNARGIEEIELKERDKNWIPDNIMLTTQEDIPIMYINSTKESPEVYPIKLATITLNAELPINFNLKVIALGIQLDEYVIGVKHEQICQRGWFKQKVATRKSKSKKSKGRKDKADFYNQCTLNVRPYGNDGDELINMKLFPNGKVGFTGVKKVVDAEVSLQIVLERINKLSHVVIYYPSRTEWGNTKNFRKKIKERQEILEYISQRTPFPVDWNKFIESINTRGKDPYPNGLPLSREISCTLTYLDILLTYYDINFKECQEEVSARIEDITGNSYFLELFDRIQSSYGDRELSIDEILTTNQYLSASKKYSLDLDKIIDLISDQPIDQQRAILKFYHQINANYTVDQIIDKLETYEFQSEIITEIRELLTNLEVVEENNDYRPRLEPSEVKLVDEFFQRLKEDKPLTAVLQNEEQINERDRFTLMLPAWSDKDGLGENQGLNIMNYYSPDHINISNINTTFNTNFVLSRKKLHLLLNNKYKQTNCSFEPNYGGIKLTYLTTIDCPEHDDPEDPEIIPEYDNCRCKGVSILIFPNITLITGGRSFRQIMQAYEFIRRIMLTEFEKIIRIDQNCPDPLDKFPNIISSNKHVYLKKKYIMDNPKNNFIIKQLKLLDSYQLDNYN